MGMKEHYDGVLQMGIVANEDGDYVGFNHNWV